MIIKKTLSEYSIGSEVEICFCDTSASCVWSHPAIVIYSETLKQVAVQGIEENIHRVYTNEMIDGCYTYLSERY